MTTHQLIDKFCQNHRELASYISGLGNDKFLLSANEKWTPGQQLVHVYLCLVPISQALSSKEYIQNKFGHIERATFTYDQVIENYRKGLQAGGKAPEQFLPQEVPLSDKTEYLDKLETILNNIQQQLAGYSEEELDTLVLPHPFLGKLSIRELFYLMAYHPTHHLEQTRKNLLNTEVTTS